MCVYVCVCVSMVYPGGTLLVCVCVCVCIHAGGSVLRRANKLWRGQATGTNLTQSPRHSDLHSKETRASNWHELDTQFPKSNLLSDLCSKHTRALS